MPGVQMPHWAPPFFEEALLDSVELFAVWAAR